MRLPYDVESDENRLPALGLIVLSVDETIESDFRRLLYPDSSRLFVNRIPTEDTVTEENLNLMGGRMTASAALLPRVAGFRAIGYGCTSGATVLGEDQVRELVQIAHPGVPVTNPLTALKAACQALNILKLGVVSPYEPMVSDALCKALDKAGINVSAFAGFYEKHEKTVARISLPSIVRAIAEIGRQDCDGVFASCTNLRTVSVLAECEKKIGKPVLASNQVLAWHMHKLAVCQPMDVTVSGQQTEKRLLTPVAGRLGAA